MTCYRLIYWLVVFVILLIPGVFLTAIIGRVGGFRPGPKLGEMETVFGWVGIVFLSTLMLVICMVAGLIDWGITSTVENLQNQAQHHPPLLNPQFLQLPPAPKPIPPEWDEAKMEKTYLSDMQELDPRVGWGSFGKKGKLGYQTLYGELVKVNNRNYPNAISMVPFHFGFSTVKYRLDRAAKLFKASAAISDTDNLAHIVESTPTFKVLGDGVILWASNPIHVGVIEECRINVEQMDVLELQVHCPGTNGSVRTVWLEPHILK